MLAHDTDPATLAGLEIVDRNGERIGRVRQVYPDGGDLGWAGVRGNLIGTTEALVPLDRAQLAEDVITVPITRARFLAAPRRTPDSTMDEEERTLLRGFYDDGPAPLDPADEPATASTEALPAAEPERLPEPEPERTPEPEPAPEPVRADRHAGAVPADRSVVPETPAAAEAPSRSRRQPQAEPDPEPAPEPVAASAPEPVAEPAPAPRASAAPSGLDGGIDRSEQRIHVSTEPVPRTRVVLRKVVITEQRTITVPVRREEFRIVREPIEDAAPVSDSVFADAEEEYVLHEERVIVRTEVVPVERIRLVREVLQEQREVTGETWREQIVADEEPV